MIHVAVLDTGLSNKMLRIGNKNISVLPHNGLSSESNSFQDLSHGDSICSQILSECPDVHIDLYPVFCTNFSDPSDILECLEKILNCNINYSIINMSFGFEDSTYYNKIRDVCNALTLKGSVLVAAHDNWGTMTYPACLESVIGVDVSEKLERTKDFIYIEGSVINVLCSANQLAAYQSNSKPILSHSTSIHAARITGMISQHFSKTGASGLCEAKRYLKMIADDTIVYSQEKIRVLNQSLGKCVLFPYTKETVTICKLNKYVSGSIYALCDFSLSRRVGEKVETYSGEYIFVSTLKQMEISKIDAIVIGHTDKYPDSFLIKELKEFIGHFQKLEKHIYLFDDRLIKIGLIDKNYKFLTLPSIFDENVPCGNMGKMWNISIPVVSVVGTSPHQGKFSLQVRIKRQMEALGYNVGFIATEPSGYLFDADYVFPYGYGSRVFCNPLKYQILLNDMIHELCKTDTEIVICGLQSALLPSNYSNAEQDTFIQHSLMFGYNPDAVLVCISPDDDIELILRTISACKINYESEVIAAVVYPAKRIITESERIVFEDVDPTNSNYIFWKQALQDKTGIELFEMDKDSIKKLVDRIVDFLSE